jgi:hypothetical protein
MNDALKIETAATSRLADHILPTSATMVGVCVTVISVAKLIPKHGISHHAVELLAIDGLFFMVSTLLSYFSIRLPSSRASYERTADVVFLFALALMVVVGFIVSFELMID